MTTYIGGTKRSKDDTSTASTVYTDEAVTDPAAFPNTPVSTTATAMSTTLTNTGNAALTINSITLTGANGTFQRPMYTHIWPDR